MAHDSIYLDCFSGISGDMFVGALLDLGADFVELKQELQKLRLNGFQVDLTSVKRVGIRAKSFLVGVEESAKTNRTWTEIKSILTKSRLDDAVKERTIELFGVLAHAEAEVHGIEPEKVHFHELGCMDSIIDITSAVICLKSLGIQSIKASPLPHNRGFVETEHGKMPLPAPATTLLIKNIPLVPSDETWEQVTPTGALLVSQLADEFGNIPQMHIKKIGYGAGDKDTLNIPNCLRCYLGTFYEDIYTDRVILFTVNIDNQNPESFTYVMDTLFKAGALDIAYTPLQMKKNRPASQLQVIAPRHLRVEIQDIILRETTTLGIRIQEIERACIKREERLIDTPWGKARIKIHFPPDSSPRFMPEHDDCARIANETKRPIHEIYTDILILAEKQLKGVF